MGILCRTHSKYVLLNSKTEPIFKYEQNAIPIQPNKVPFQKWRNNKFMSKRFSDQQQQYYGMYWFIEVLFTLNWTWRQFISKRMVQAPFFKIRITRIMANVIATGVCVFYSLLTSLAFFQTLWKRWNVDLPVINTIH